MTIRAIDAAGDWLFGQGKQCYRVGAAAVYQDIDTALRVFLGECFFDTAAGVDWLRLIGSSDANGIVVGCRQVIASRDGVTKINSVSPTRDVATRRLSVAYDVSTKYSLRAARAVAAPAP